MPDNQPLKTLPADAKVINNTPLKALPKDTQILGAEAPNRSSGLDYSLILGAQRDKNKVEDAVNWVQQGGRRDGESILDSEKDALRDVIGDNRATPEQVKRAIQVIQGRDPKHSEGNVLYYFKQEDNGVMMPQALAYGEKPPKGYDVASTWGSSREAKDDSWYTDLGKSIFNGMMGVGQGAVDLAQLGTTAITGEESKYLNKLSNTAEALKFKKDEDLQKPIYNTQGVENWGDLVSKDRFDLSPDALWGTLNMAGESLVGFLGGAGATSQAIKGIKGVETLSKGEIAASAFTGSFLQQLGDNMDGARDAGLKGRDISTFAMLTTGAQASIDAALGLESKIFRSSFKKAEKDLLKELGKTVEKDAAGMITEEGFKQLAKNTTLQYSQMAGSWLKEFGKDAIIEGGQEAGQDVIEKSAEQLWDKMTPNDRAKFGTDASSPQAFASYIQNGLTGLIAGAPMAAYTAKSKEKYNEQSINALETVQKGPEAINELKQNLKVAKDKGHLSDKEYEQAVFKVDAYNTYNEQTKDLDLNDEQKKEAFELSFNIEGLKSEINFKPEDIEKLDPIAIAKIDSKKELIKGMQKKLNDIILREDVKKETKVGDETKKKIIKNDEKKAEDTTLDDFEKRYGGLKTTEVKSEKTTRRPLADVSLEEWNDRAKMTSLQHKQILQEHLKNAPNNEIEATLQEGENGTIIAVLPDGKKINLAQSAESIGGKTVEHIIRKNLPKTKEFGKVVDKGGNAIESEPGKPLYSYKEPVAIKRVEIKAFDKQGNPKLNDDGKQKKLAVLSIYNKETGGHIVYAREKDRLGFKKYESSSYSPKEIEQLEAIKKANHLTEEIKPFSRVTEPKVEKPISKIDFDKAASRAKTERELDRVIDEATKAEYPLDFDIVSKQRDKIRASEQEKQVSAYRIGDVNGEYVFYSKTQDYVEEYANTHGIEGDVKQYDLKYKNPIEIEMSHDDFTDFNKQKPLLEKARKDGYDFVIFKPEKDSGWVGEEFYVKIKQATENKLEDAKEKAEEIVKPEKTDSAKTKQEKEAVKKELDKIYSQYPKTFEEAVVRYFISKGRISTADFKRYTGFGVKDKTTGRTKGFREYRNYIWAYKNDARSIDNLVKDIWVEDMNMPEDNFDEQDLINEFFSVLQQHSGRGSLLGRLFDIQKENTEENASPEAIAYAKELEEEEKYKNTRELTPQEVEEELAKESAREQVFAETGQFQKQSNERNVKGLQEVVEAIQKAMPKVTVVYDKDLKSAGRLQGNIISINPYYAGKDTPIHEAGHVLIDAIGYTNKVIQSGIEQLKPTQLWQETRERYPELNEEQLGKEVLAEAIGREGAGIFEQEAQKSRFKQILDYIFTRLKQLLGIDKNVAKSLAKQVLGGMGTKELTGKSQEAQEQKPKKYKELEELSAAELARKTTKSFENYRTDVLGRNLEQIRKDLIDINKALESDKYTEDQKDALMSYKEAIKQQEKKDKSKWMAYREDVAVLSSAMSDGKLEDYSIDKLVELYNLMQTNFQDAAKETRFKKVMEQIAYKMFQKRKEELKQYKGFVEEQANKQDLAPKDRLMKVLSHMTENFPELQELSKMFDNAYLDMQNDRYSLKNDLEKLGKAVIKERNKKLGLGEKAASLVFSNSAKYFDFIEHPEGRYYTLEEAKQKGFTEAQTKFLKFMLDLNELRRKQLDEMGTFELNEEILKVDKGVGEAFQTEGLLQAFSAYLGNGYNIRNVRINYNGKPTTYGEIEQDLVKQAQKGTIEKAKALVQMLKYNFAARRQLKKGVNIDEKDNPLFVKENSEYHLTTDGQLKSKFNKARDKERSYSKDFYHAAFEFIDDYTHVKHMNPLLPYINSIEHINKVGFGEHGAKNNVAEWVRQWKDLHIFKTDKPGALGPEVDAALRMLRKLSSLSVMAFNIPAGLWNIAMGTYNNLRAETAKQVGIGSKRLIKDGVFDKKAADILKKYQVVSIDYDSNPKLFAGKLFDALAYGLTRAGEYYIQGSMFLGLMSDKEYNSFEYKTDANGVKELVVKPGVDEKALSEKLVSYKNRVSDIQGKYADKDKRNFMMGEFGKAVMQYKIWVPDAIKQRFGDRYIDRNGVEHIGSFRTFWGQGLADLREEARSKGWINTVANSNSAHAKAMRSNIKGIALVAVFMSLRLANDDDERKRRKADNIDKALGNLLFIFDPKTAKFMIENPIPAASVVLNLVNAVEAAGKGDFVKSGKSIGRDIPYNKVATTVEDLLED